MYQFSMDLSSRSVLGALGAFTFLTTAYNLTCNIWTYVRPSSLPRYLETKDGSPPWALITGASDGIGKAFAGELASHGFDIVLHGRNPDKLDVVKADLELRFPNRHFRVVVADAGDLSPETFGRISKEVEDISLKILINNAGATMELGHEFDTIENYTVKELRDNIAVNGTFPILLTGALMPKLIDNQPSLIINVGTIADVGMPLFPAYAPAKASLLTSTMGLAMDQYYKKRDIEVIMMRVASVSQTGTIVTSPTLLAPDAPTWVKSAVGRVGCGKVHLFPYVPHALQVAVLTGLPDFISRGMKIAGIEEQMALDPTGARAKKAAKGVEKKGQ